MNATSITPFNALQPPRTGLSGIAAAVALHLALLGVVLTYQPATLVQTEAQPIMVSFIAPQVEAPAPAPAPPKPVIQPRPQPVVHPKPEPAKILRSERTEPTPFAAPPAPKPEPEPKTRPEPAAEPAPVPPAPKTVEAPRDAEIAPPRFNADYLRNPKPNYPGLSRRLHEEGTVVVRVYVSPQGAPERVELSKSSGYARLDESALETIRAHWKFAPARQGSAAVGAWVLVPIAFTLEG